jgi:molybdate transport system ATP-binding protein
MLNVEIKKTFGAFCLNVQLHAKNEILALLGASGSGKSMTLKCIAGIETPDEGRIELDGKVLFDSAQKINLPPQQRKVGYLFQNYALFPNMTVEENIGVGVSGSYTERKEIVKRALQVFCLSGLEHRYPSQLSGGQQQRVAMARMLASRPKILMLDEPLSALDSHLRWQMEQELRNVLQQFNGTALYVSHNRDEVYRLCDRIAVISEGHLEVTNEKWHLFENPKTLAAAKLTGCKNISRATKISDHTILTLDWGTALQTNTIVPDNLHYVGVRAHDWIPADSTEESNVIQGHTETILEDTFSYIVFYRPLSNNSNIIYWIAPKSSRAALPPSPKFLRIHPQNILLLTG